MVALAAEVLTSTKDMERAEWLNWRKKGIGGSDAAAIAGLSKWRSPATVYLEKVGDIEPEEPGEAAYWGTVLESIIAEEFTKRTGVKVHRRNAILQHPEHPWMIANLDRIIIDKTNGHGVLEVKTAGEYKRDEWEDDKIPDAYMIQMQHYLAVTGLAYGYFAVLLGGQRYIHKHVERDDDIIASLIKIESDFWRLVESKTPPAMDGNEASTEVLNLLYPKAEAGSQIPLPSEAETLIADYEAAVAEEKEWGLRKDESANKLKVLLGSNEVGLVGDRKVSWKTISQARLDTKALQADHPDLYAKYVKASEYRRFSIK